MIKFAGQKLRQEERGDALLDTVKNHLFPFLREGLEGVGSLSTFFKNAECLIPKGSLMKTAVQLIDQLPLQDRDTKGDLYEYLLSKLTTAGINGQFRTPRHIIKTMVEMLDPKPYETVTDPACGTAGFLIETMSYLQKKYSSSELIHDAVDENGEVLKDQDGNTVKAYPGDLLTPNLEHIQNDMFTGFDFDTTMVRVGAMNMMLHGIDKPSIEYQDTLGNSFMEHYPKKYKDYFDVILANPPFKGTIDEENIASSLKKEVKTKKSELLFLSLILRMLKIGGRAAVVVPDGVLFGSSKAHVGIRKMIVDDNQLEAVISLPSGVFKPYAGVSTAILIFAKGGRTDNVWYYDLEHDGYSLDDKRTREADKDDLPNLLEQWRKRKEKAESKRTDKFFYVPADEIRENSYDLSINRYKETKYEEVDYGDPKDILAEIKTLQEEVLSEISELQEMI